MKKNKVFSQIKNYLKKPIFQLALVLILALALRLYKITNPVLDWHAWRQADTASVTRQYVKNEIDLLRPTFHDLSNIPSGKFNPQGYRMVEFPLINALVAVVIKTFPRLNLVAIHRLVSVLFSLGTLVGLYWLIKQICNHQTALLSALFFAITPFSVYYSRVILPEPAVLFFSTLSLASFNAYLKNQASKQNLGLWLLSAVSLALAFLLKPFVVFLAPVYLYLILISKKNLSSVWQDKLLLIYPVLAVAPFFGWRRWITNFPAGIPASDWLFNGDGIRLRPAWFRWLFYERITKLILGFIGLIFLPFNLIKKNKGFWLVLVWGLGMLAYLIVIATGNVRHDYYQVLLNPWLSFTLGRGAFYLYQQLNKKTNLALVAIILLISGHLFFAWKQVKGYYQVNHGEYLTAGQVADKILPPKARVIAPAMGDTQFLFQTNRVGWPIGFEINKKIEQGATHYITTSMNQEAKELKEKYIIVKETQDYLILDLTKEK